MEHEGWLRSAIGGIEWPAIPTQPASRMLAVLFQLDRSQWASSGESWHQQRRQLRTLLQHAVTNVPYYGRSLASHLDSLPGRFSLDEFARLPLLTRADLQQSFQDLRALHFPAAHGGAMESATSGSTGEPVRYLFTPMAMFFWHAFALREHFWHKRDFLSKMLVIRAGSEPVTQSSWFGETGAGTEMLRTGPCVVLPAAWTFDRQLERILEERPQYLLGYAGNLWGVLQAAERQGATMPWLREVRSFGETVKPEMRAYVRARWNVPLTDVYTSREAGYLAIQCPDHEAYHIQSESALVEVVDDLGRHCIPGQIGRVVVTPLHNFGMPLIRYDIGDYAEVGEPCACGRTLPVLKRIHGRIRNILRLPDGSKRWPTLGTEKLRDIAPILRYKVVQKTLQDVEIRLIVERPLAVGELAALRSHLTEKLGYPFNWKVLFFDQFPPEPGDKFEDFVSEVD